MTIAFPSMRAVLSVLALVMLAMGSIPSLMAAEDVGERVKQGAVAEQGGGGDVPLIADAQRRHDLTRLRGVSPLVGALLLIVAVVPLFFGYRFLRLAIGFLSGAYAAMLMWQYGMGPLHGIAPSADGETLRVALVVCSLIALLIGFALGWFLYKLQLGLAGALLGLMVMSLPGLYLDWPWLTLALMIIGAVIGFIAGWIAAPFWAALQTAVLGGFLVVQGTAIITQQGADDHHVRLIAFSAGILAAIIGFAFQVAGIRRQKQSPPA